MDEQADELGVGEHERQVEEQLDLVGGVVLFLVGDDKALRGSDRLRSIRRLTPRTERPERATPQRNRQSQRPSPLPGTPGQTQEADELSTALRGGRHVYRLTARYRPVAGVPLRVADMCTADNVLIVGRLHDMLAR